LEPVTSQLIRSHGRIEKYILLNVNLLNSATSLHATREHDVVAAARIWETLLPLLESAVELLVRGFFADTEYGVWSPEIPMAQLDALPCFIVDNVAANIISCIQSARHIDVL
jgi:hypothetical protein